MVLYLTPDAYRVGGFGMDLSSFTDPELANILTGASARVNTFCSAPNLPQQHDFRGGTISNERHVWSLWNYPNQRRVYPWHQPVKAVTSLQIHVTEQNYINIQTQDMFINNSAGYVEVVALTLGIGIFPVYANLSLSQPVAAIGYTYGWSFPVTGEQLYETDGQTFRATNQWWDSTVTPAIYKNGTLQTTGYTVQYTEGTVTFDAELDAGDVVTADYTYTLPYAIARATGVIATDIIGQSRIAARGMIGLSRIHVAEIDITRQAPSAVTAGAMVPDEAATLLAPYVFRAA